MMTKQIVNLLVVMLFATTLISCLESDSDNPEQVDVADLPIAETPVLSESTSSFDIENRKWQSRCMPTLPGALRPGFMIAEYRFSGEVFTSPLHEYYDSFCAQTSTSGGAGIEGSLSYGRQFTTPSGFTAQEIDMQYESEVQPTKGLIARDGKQLRLALSEKGSPRPADVDDAMILYEITPAGPNASVNVEGRWKRECTQRKTSVEGLGFYMHVFQFLGSDVYLTEGFYDNNSCSESEATKKSEYPGRLAFGKELTTPSGITAYELDMTFDTFEWRGLIAQESDQLRLRYAKNDKRPDDVVSGPLLSKLK
jgi:hypothetical protein